MLERVASDRVQPSGRNTQHSLAALVLDYLDPPERAVVLCVDERSQIQALDRTQPGLPLKKGRVATMTHDYKRQSLRSRSC